MHGRVSRMPRPLWACAPGGLSRGTWRALPAVLILALAPSACSAPPPDAQEPAAGASPEAARKVLLIGIDGVRPDVLAEVPTPHLDSLVATGAYSDRALTGLPTVSGPSWASMLTGVWKEKHGIAGNDFPYAGHGLDRFPDFLTRIERERPGLRTLAVADWLPLVSLEDGVPVIGDEVDEKVVMDGYELGWAEADERSVDEAVRRLRDGEHDAVFVYLGNPDEVSHQTGSIGAPYREAIAAADGQVGRLMAALRARATYAQEDWLVLVSTDHGRRPDGGHGGDSPEERTIFFLAWGPAVQPGPIAGTPEIVDVAVTALAHMGLAPDPAWELDGEVVGTLSDPTASVEHRRGGSPAR